MADEKKISAKEAALAVLKKAEEILKSRQLAKAEEMPVAENPDKEADAQLGENVEHLVEDHEQKNPEAHEDPLAGAKGHIKLAKFLGRMEHKRGKKNEAPAPHQQSDEKQGG